MLLLWCRIARVSSAYQVRRRLPSRMCAGMSGLPARCWKLRHWICSPAQHLQAHSKSQSLCLTLITRDRRPAAPRPHSLMPLLLPTPAVLLLPRVAAAAAAAAAQAAAAAAAATLPPIVQQLYRSKLVMLLTRLSKALLQCN